jgi:hypothetical protein
VSRCPIKVLRTKAFTGLVKKVGETCHNRQVSLV